MHPLTWLTALPLAAFLVSASLLAWRARQLVWIAPLDAGPFAEQLRALIARGDHDAARELSRVLRPSWGAELASHVLGSRDGDREPHEIASEWIADLREREASQFLIMRTLGRAAFPLALAIAIVEMGSGFTGDRGLLALQRGLAESLAIERASFAIACGFAASTLAQLGLRMQQRESRSLLSGLSRVESALRLATSPSAAARGA